jgi:hypothetical protein
LFFFFTFLLFCRYAILKDGLSITHVTGFFGILNFTNIDALAVTFALGGLGEVGEGISTQGLVNGRVL